MELGQDDPYLVHSGHSSSWWFLPSDYIKANLIIRISTGKYRADAYIVDDSNKRFYLTEKVVEVTSNSP